MYDYVLGEIVEKGPAHVVVDCGGVGYRLTMGPRCLRALPDSGSAKVWAHLHVREDDQRLYGFASRAERGAFECLLGASGVGPALALQILAQLAPAELRRAVISEDVKRITGARGVGQKTARKLVLDLKSTLEKRIDLDDGRAGGDRAAGRDAIALPVDQALRALLALGFSPAAAESAVKKALESSTEAASSVETLVRLALKAG